MWSTFIVQPAFFFQTVISCICLKSIVAKIFTYYYEYYNCIECVYTARRLYVQSVICCNAQFKIEYTSVPFKRDLCSINSFWSRFSLCAYTCLHYNRRQNQLHHKICTLHIFTWTAEYKYEADIIGVSFIFRNSKNIQEK